LIAFGIAKSFVTRVLVDELVNGVLGSTSRKLLPPPVHVVSDSGEGEFAAAMGNMETSAKRVLRRLGETRGIVGGAIAKRDQRGQVA
jgi:hypothetical protein